MAGPFVLTFEVMGDVQVARSFSRFADDVKDLSDAFREIAADFREGEEQQFRSEGGTGSSGWTPLAATTIERKARGGWPLTILVREGDLMRSLTKGGGDNIEEIRPLELRVGTKIPYAGYHQKSEIMPARPVIQLTEGQKTRWHKIIQKYLVQQMRAEFKGLMPTARAGAVHLRSIR